MKQIPENFIDFLQWVKEETELFWSIDPKTSDKDFVCEDWIHGARWIGLTENQIEDIERKYSIIFTPEHRAFLKILHSIDRKEKIKYTETFDEDAEVSIEETPFFYNWLEDDIEITEKFKWPFRTVFEDVIGPNQVWLKSWGKRPASEQEMKEVYTDWYNKTPALIPLTSHRFLVSDVDLNYRPVLSVWGSDIIVYGWDFKSYLLRELQDHLNIKEMVYDTEDKYYYAELIEEVKIILDNDHAFDKNKIIPYWQEMILIWTSGWSGFGLKYQYENNSTIQPIMKTYTPENTTNEQKTFNNFDSSHNIILPAESSEN